MTGLTLHVRTLHANVYLLHSPAGRLLVDAGSPLHAAAFARLLHAFRPDALLVTHAHLDHLGGAFLAARLGLPVLAHPLEVPRLTGREADLSYPAGRPGVARALFGAAPKVPAGMVSAVQEGDRVLGWEVLHLPGHTAGQIGLWRDGHLIAGDAVLAGPDGAHLPKPKYNADHAQALATLKRVAGLDARVVWPGHGGPLTPAQVRARAVRDDPRPPS